LLSFIVWQKALVEHSSQALHASIEIDFFLLCEQYSLFYLLEAFDPVTHSKVHVFAGLVLALSSWPVISLCIFYVALGY
jgi:hypothetical protein